MGFNILIVDDSDIIRSMIARTIRMAGVPVGSLLFAENGARGLELLNSNSVDLVFADINMPVMDGVRMIENMHAHEALCNVPVVVISTEGSESKIEKLYEYGVAAFIRKPFTPEMIRGAIVDVLGEWDESPELPTDSF